MLVVAGEAHFGQADRRYLSVCAAHRHSMADQRSTAHGLFNPPLRSAYLVRALLPKLCVATYRD